MVAVCLDISTLTLQIFFTSGGKMFCIFWGGFDTSLIQRVDAGKRCPPMTGIEEIEANYTMCFIKLVYGVYIKILSLQTCSTLTACDSLVVFYLAKFHFITPNICQYWSVPEKPVVGLWILLIPKKNVQMICWGWVLSCNTFCLWMFHFAAIPIIAMVFWAP